MQSVTYVGELALDCGDTGSIGDISKADFVATGNSCVAGRAACSNDRTSSALTQIHAHQSALLNYTLETCEVSRFDPNSNRPFLFNSKVIGRFKNFRIGYACPLLAIVK